MLTSRISRPAFIMMASLACGMLWLCGAQDTSAQSKAVPKRSEIAEKYRWDLTTFYANDAGWEKEFEYLDGRLKDFDSYKGKLGESTGNLEKLMLMNDTLDKIMSNLYVYANLRLDEDRQQNGPQEMAGKVGGLYARYSEATSFITPELLSLPPDYLTKAVANQPGLKIYDHYFKNMVRTKAHTLSEREEELLAMASSAMRGHENTFEMATTADMRWGTVKDEKGEEIQLTRERYVSLLESPDRRVRRDANRVYNEAFEKRANTLASTLAGSVKADYFQAKARGYKSTLEMKLDGDNIPESVFRSLVSAVNANLAPLHRYVALRKKALNLDTIQPFDLDAPLVDDPAANYPYEKGVEMVLGGLAPMGKQYVTDMQNGFNARWVDVYETEGKATGAYQWGTYTSHPCLLMNYNGTLESVFTLGHEMGHAMHSFYTNKQEPNLYSGHYIFTAEVASTCNEAVMMKDLMSRIKNPDEKIVLIDYYIDQIMGTFYTQVAFSEFELAIHDEIANGGALSTEFVRKTWRDIYQKYWGPEMFINEYNDMTGLRIGHFYSSYYVYQYATCYAAAQALSEKIMKDGKKFLPTYMNFLGTGRSKYPVDVLKAAGVDMTTAEPVNAVLRIFDNLVTELEKAIAQKS